jgi:hypothetical protein
MLCCPLDIFIRLYTHNYRLSPNLPDFLSLSSYTIIIISIPKLTILILFGLADELKMSKN